MPYKASQLDGFIYFANLRGDVSAVLDPIDRMSDDVLIGGNSGASRSIFNMKSIASKVCRNAFRPDRHPYLLSESAAIPPLIAAIADVMRRRKPLAARQVDDARRLASAEREGLVGSRKDMQERKKRKAGAGASGGGGGGGAMQDAE